jgi:hypothetical protein
VADTDVQVKFDAPAFGNSCPSLHLHIICMKFTPRRNLIWSARFCRRTTLLSWRGSGIFSENETSFAPLARRSSQAKSHQPTKRTHDHAALGF